MGLMKLLRKSSGRSGTAALPDSIDCGGRSVPLLVREHPTARRIVMRLAPGGTAIKLTVPRRTPARTVLAFWERHRGWAEERIAGAPQRQTLRDGAVIPFRGEALRIVHQPGRRAAKFETAADGAACLLVGAEADHLGRRVSDVLKREARRDLQAAVDRHSEALGIRPRAMALKDTVSRWGSCSADRRLSFSWRIVMAPPFVLDYLAAHEVAHLREMNHGEGFWRLCRELCPGMDEGRDWLKRRGGELHAVDFT